MTIMTIQNINVIEPGCQKKTLGQQYWPPKVTELANKFLKKKQKNNKDNYAPEAMLN